jgi:T5SS/PEP-CTERM-associated repeat protein
MQAERLSTTTSPRVSSGATLYADEPLSESATISSILGTSGTTNTVSVDGTGAELDDPGGYIFAYGAAGLSITNGATLLVGTLSVNASEGSGTGTVTVDGENSLLNAANVNTSNGTIVVSSSSTLALGLPGQDLVELNIGQSGTADLIVESGGTVTDANAFNPEASYTFGSLPSGQGTGTVTGNNSVLDLENAPVYVGLSGTGTLSVTDGALAVFDEMYIADSSGSQGTVAVDGTDSLLSAGSIDVGNYEGGTAVLNISDGAAVEASTVQIFASGSVNLAGGELDTDPLAIASGGSIGGNGTITGDIANSGTIIASGGTLELTGEISGSGVLVIRPGAVLLLDGTVDSGVLIDFESDGTGVLELDDPADMQGTVQGIVPGDQIIDVTCYMKGVRIKAAAGDIAVEDVIPGDLVQTEFSGLVPVKWIGYRHMFENADAPLLLHPYMEEENDQARREAESCAPLVCDAARVEPIWRMLAACAEELGLPPRVVETTDDPMLCMRVGDREFRPVTRVGDRHQFLLPRIRNDARLFSRSAAPSATRPWVDDHRQLGVAIRRITVRSSAQYSDIALDDPRLADGWWEAERDKAAMWRWTNGDATLPIEGDRVTVEVVVSGTVPYPMPERCPAKIRGAA